jgi:hypothetical protein
MIYTHIADPTFSNFLTARLKKVSCQFLLQVADHLPNSRSVESYESLEDQFKVRHHTSVIDRGSNPKQ